ncbi:MFS transporter [Paenibacillus sp. NPDC058174]|uniref:MFS transporter n=1 Tax=Paenibacillus sp. NPDC058174 TaxID=3346366 RepID=UPI0036DDF5B5
MVTSDSQLPVASGRQLMIAIALGAFLSHFTAGIVNVSLPQFADSFNSRLDTVQWITTGYLLVITILLPLMGKLGDRFGSGIIHNAGLGLFTLSSLLIVFSPGISSLLAFRFIQAVGAAMFQATNMALLAKLMPAEKRGQALGIISGAVAIGGMAGPAAGGLIGQSLSWHWLFIIQVPFAAVASLLAFRFIPLLHHRTDRNGSFDVTGAMLFMSAIGLLVAGLSHSGTENGVMRASFFYTGGIGLAALIVFLLWERKHPTPFLPMRALAVPAVSIGLLISTVTFMAANTVIVSLPFFFYSFAVLSSSSVGLLMTIYPACLAIAGPIAGRWSDRLGSRRLLLIGLLSMGSGMAVLALTLANFPMISAIAGLALCGLGMALIASPNMNFIMSHTAKEHIGSVGGLIALTRNLGLVIGASLGLGTVKGSSIGEQNWTLFHMVMILLIGLCVILMALIIWSTREQLAKRLTSLSYRNSVK